MRTFIYFISILFSVQTFANEDILFEGQDLHSAHCVTCHADLFNDTDGSTIYTRSDRRVNDIERLKTMVSLCEANFNLGWFPEEVDAVVYYLNHEYYRFGLENLEKNNE